MVHVNSFSSGFGERLRIERDRKGYSQADLAEKLGIHRNTQARYERAETQPSPSYLTALRSLGIDIEFVLTGVRRTGEEAGASHRALVHLVGVIFDTLRLTPYEKEFDSICRVASDEAAAVWRDGVLRAEIADRATESLIKKSPLVIDETLFADLIERVEFVVESRSLVISPHSKARAVLQLYALAKSQEKPVNLNTIRSALEAVR